MADQDIQYPIPVFHYRVTIAGDNSYAFSEISGLNVAYQPIIYRDGMSYKEGAKYMPGLADPYTLTMKKGIVRKSSYLFRWISTINLNKVEKRDLTIELLDTSSDTNQEAAVVWKLTGAFPYKLDLPSFDANSNEVAIESVELMASSMTVKYAGDNIGDISFNG